MVPTFGRDTIRRFSSNVSELKRLTARDFEDLLQVCPLETSLQDGNSYVTKVRHPRF